MEKDDSAHKTGIILFGRKEYMCKMKHYLPTDPEIYVLGRTKMGNPLPLFWTGSGVELDTDSSCLWFDVETDYETWEEWIRIEIDGVCMQRMLLEKGRKQICAFRNLPSGVHRKVRLLKEVQPVREDEKKCLLLHEIICDGQLYQIPQKKWKIEFVGDSLSAGEGLGGAASLTQAGSAGYGLTGHYAITVADHFQADFRILAESGWGVHCSCYNDLIQIMPKYYEKICGTVTGERNRELGAFEDHDFMSWKPDIIIVNLGSNDGFALDMPEWTDPLDGTIHKQSVNAYGGVEEESAIRFEESVISFLKKLRRYNEKAYILWAYGMCGHRMAPYLDHAVLKYKEETKDRRVDLQILPMAVPMWIGCNGHPGEKDHHLTAQVLIHRLESCHLLLSGNVKPDI